MILLFDPKHVDCHVTNANGTIRILNPSRFNLEITLRLFKIKIGPLRHGNLTTE